MAVPSRRTTVDTADQLRHEIDSGRTGDKVDHPDPAAAPLGTDEEAAGTPLSREAVQAAADQQMSAAPTAPTEDRAVTLFAVAVLVLVLLTLLATWAVLALRETAPI